MGQGCCCDVVSPALESATGDFNARARPAETQLFELLRHSFRCLDGAGVIQVALATLDAGPSWPLLADSSMGSNQCQTPVGGQRLPMRRFHPAESVNESVGGDRVKCPMKSIASIDSRSIQSLKLSQFNGCAHVINGGQVSFFFSNE